MISLSGYSKIVSVCCVKSTALINFSINAGYVPKAWKHSIISHVPKVQPVYFRPISVTSVFSRISERLVVRDYLRSRCYSTGCREAIHDEFLLAEPCIKCVTVSDMLEYVAADKCSERMNE